jgi:hypothetical protein
MKTKLIRKWERKLGARLTQHVRTTTPNGTLAQVRVNLAGQRKSPATRCWDCERIARLLKLDPPTTTKARP